MFNQSIMLKVFFSRKSNKFLLSWMFSWSYSENVSFPSSLPQTPHQCTGEKRILRSIGLAISTSPRKADILLLHEIIHSCCAGHICLIEALLTQSGEEKRRADGPTLQREGPASAYEAIDPSWSQCNIMVRNMHLGLRWNLPQVVLQTLVKV